MKKIQLVIFLVVVIQLVLSLPADDNLIIALPDGKIQGAVYQTPNNVSYYGWRGIPFASPPVGSLRFGAPQPPQPWSGVLDATNDGKSCPSIYYLSAAANESEDCLYINVYSRHLEPSTKLPVMFWIYGGAFNKGNSSKLIYGPDFLVEEDIVFVSFNYRVGPFGFLSTEDSVLRGNAGLKDQNLALRWTYENIALFGGDPEKITIFGQSAGGASTGLHIVSKKSAGLFRAAVIESGSALVQFAIEQTARSYAFSLANNISSGDYGNDSQILKEFLLGRTTEEIIKAEINLGNMVSPVIEVEDEEAFISESPYQLLESGRFSQVPIIAGICAEESLLYLKDMENAANMAHYADYVPISILPIDLYPNSTYQATVIEKIKEIYLKESELWSDNLVGLAGLYSDNLFTRGTIRHAELASNYVPVHLYQFSYYGRAWTPAFLEGAEKAGHTAELTFLFNMVGYQDVIPPNVLVQNRTVKLWTNFAKFLNPLPEKTELLNITWPTINSTYQPYLNINGTLDLRYNLKENSFPKWKTIFEDYGRKPFITF